MAEVILEPENLKGRSVHELAADSWNLITYHRGVLKVLLKVK